MVNEHYGNEDCAGYNDFRDLLARDDLDAVSIATPDHWHAIPAIAAAKRGLDIYAEKPLALTIEQGRVMTDTVARYGVVWQTGSWQRSHAHFRHACELVRNGRIGDVHTVKVGLPTGSGCGPQPEAPIPDGFDYDMWLGPAPYAPYTNNRCHWNFRWILDYSGGQLTNNGAHWADIGQWAIGADGSGPVEVEGSRRLARLVVLRQGPLAVETGEDAERVDALRHAAAERHVGTEFCAEGKSPGRWAVDFPPGPWSSRHRPVRRSTPAARRSQENCVSWYFNRGLYESFRGGL